MPPAVRPFPSLKEIVVKEIVRARSLFGELYKNEYDLFDPVPCKFIDRILDEYCHLDGIGPNLLTANEICMLITTSTTKLDLNKLRVHRHNVPHAFITDALATRCTSSLTELNLSRWGLSVKDINVITFFCRNIQKLNLSFGRVTDEHIQILSNNCPALKQLNLQDEQQNITSEGLLKIAHAKFQLESLTVSGENYKVEDIITLLKNQIDLNHIRISNLIEALCLYAQDESPKPLALSQLILLEIGSHIENWMSESDVSSILGNVTALEIDHPLLEKIMRLDPLTCLGITKLENFRDLKIRENIGSRLSSLGSHRHQDSRVDKISKVWNTFLGYPCFKNIKFLQLESGLQIVYFPNVRHLSLLERLIIRNSQIMMVTSVEGTYPEFPERLSELIISNIKYGLPCSELKELFEKSYYLEYLCLHYLSTAEPQESTKDFTDCIEKLLPRLRKFHISISKKWTIDSQALIEFILSHCGSEMTDLQLNDLVLTPELRQWWTEYVHSNYNVKFTLLE